MSQGKYTLLAVQPKIEEFLKPMLRAGGFDVSFRICEGETRHPDFENPDIVVKFSGPDTDLLLANKAELLLALEQLTMEILRVPGEEHSLVCFDANDYRMLRIEELRLSALTAAEKVKRSGAPFCFNPMNSRERRIIHLALREETAVRSESAGMGAYRQVIVYPAGMPSQPQLAVPPMERPSSRPPMRRGPRRRF
ncbi:MAG: R3H domain-containing nucleic acid-binding protein [Bryobacteraceae bacterium]